MGDGKEQVIGNMFYYNMVVKGFGENKMVGSKPEHTQANDYALITKHQSVRTNP